MRLKIKLVLAITGLVFVVVTVFSWISLSQLLGEHIDQSWASNDVLAHNVVFQVRQALDTGLARRRFDPNDPVAVRAAVASTLREDPGLIALLNSLVNYSNIVLDVSIADRNGQALVTEPETSQQDQPLPARPDYTVLRHLSLIRNLHIIFGKPRVYNVTAGLDRDNQPFLTVRIGIRTTFLRSAFEKLLV